MTVCVNIKRPIFKGFNTIWSLLTEESRPLVSIVRVLTLFGVCMVMGMAVTTFLLSHVVIPSIYLKTNVIIESGNGSSTNPYILSLDV